MKIKTILKNILDITDYLKNILAELGFSVIEDFSKLSNSEYITITNWRQTVGKGNDDLLIRISDHDLPPSYDGKYGYYDFDLKSKYDSRKGLQGNAIPYLDFIEYIVDLIKENNNIEVQDIEKILFDKKFLDFVYDKIDDYNLRFKIMDLQDMKTIKQVQSYIDEYMYDDELETLVKEYENYK